MNTRNITLTGGAAVGGLLTAAFLSAGIAIADIGDDNLIDRFADAAAAAASGDPAIPADFVSAFNSADLGFDITNPNGDDTFGVLNPLTDAPNDTVTTFDASVNTTSFFGIPDTTVTVTDLGPLDLDGDGAVRGDTFVDFDGDGTPNESLANIAGTADIDGDGVTKGADSFVDIDHDGIPFFTDLYPNTFDDGDGVDADGDGIGRLYGGSDPNVNVDFDGDGLNFSHDPFVNVDGDAFNFSAEVFGQGALPAFDFDGDGETAQADPSIDADGDGITFANDHNITADPDGDGTPLGDTFIDIDGDGTPLADEADPAALLDPLSLPTVGSVYDVETWQGLFGDWTFTYSNVLSSEESPGTVLDGLQAQYPDADLVDPGVTANLSTPFGDIDLTDLFTTFGIGDWLF